MTLDQIAAELGLDLRTVKRDCASIAASFRAAGIDLSTLTLGDSKFLAAVIVDELQKKCPDDSELTSVGSRDPHVANDTATRSEGRAGRIPQRWSKP